MPAYALIKAGAYVRDEVLPKKPDDIPHKQVVWLPIEVTKPAFNPVTQVRSGPVDTVLADKVARVWTVRDKTAAELDNEKALQVDGTDLALLRVAFNHENRIRTLEGRAQVTMAQFKGAVKDLL